MDKKWRCIIKDPPWPVPWLTVCIKKENNAFKELNHYIDFEDGLTVEKIARSRKDAILNLKHDDKHIRRICKFVLEYGPMEVIWKNCNKK